MARELALEAGTAAHVRSSTGEAAAPDTGIARMRVLPAALLLDAVRLTPIQQVQHFVPVATRVGIKADISEAQQAFTHGCRILIDKVAQLEDAALLGSLMRWMCSVLPVDHRPAVNISKVINSAHAPQLEDVPEGAVDSLGIPVDAARHADFWRLQASVAATDVLTNAESWAACARQIETVLGAFASGVQVRPRCALL